MKVLVISLLLFPLFAAAQMSKTKLSDHFIIFYNRVNDLHGNVYMDTFYRKLDTNQLKKDLGVEVEDEIRFIREFKLKLADFDISKLNNLKSKMVTGEQFWKLQDDTVMLSEDEIQYSEKLDSFYRAIQKNYEENLFIQNILLSSTFNELSSKRYYKAKKKWLQIASIYENENFLLIIYSVSALYGYLHSNRKSELIIK